MVEIYNVLESQFPDYEKKLQPMPESSVFLMTPEWGRAYIPPHHSILMRSVETDILIQHDIQASIKNNPFIGMEIYYYPRGENSRERLNELNNPMREMKQCLINNFPDLIKEDDFTETFYKAPHPTVAGLQALTIHTIALGGLVLLCCIAF